MRSLRKENTSERIKRRLAVFIKWAQSQGLVCLLWWWIFWSWFGSQVCLWKSGGRFSGPHAVVSWTPQGPSGRRGAAGPDRADEEVLDHSEPQFQTTAFLLRHSQYVLSDIVNMIFWKRCLVVYCLCFVLDSNRQRQDRSVWTTAHSLAGRSTDQTDCHRAARDGRATILEGQQQGQSSHGWSSASFKHLRLSVRAVAVNLHQ